MQCDLNLIQKYGMSARYKLQVTAIAISESLLLKEYLEKIQMT